jgi:hypothetical protein
LTLSPPVRSFPQYPERHLASVPLPRTRARQSADDAVDRVKTMLGARSATSLNVACALIYSTYANVLLGEGFGEAPVNLSAPLPAAELFTRAIARFDEAIAIASAVRLGTDSTNVRGLIRLA